MPIERRVWFIVVIFLLGVMLLVAVLLAACGLRYACKDHDNIYSGESHTHTQTHTHTHSHTHTPLPSFKISTDIMHTFTLTHIHSFTRNHIHSLTHSLTHTHTHTVRPPANEKQLKGRSGATGRGGIFSLTEDAMEDYEGRSGMRRNNGDLW